MYRPMLALLLLSCVDEEDPVQPPPIGGYAVDDDGEAGGGSGSGSGGGGSSTADPSSDNDGDGFTLAEEEEAGTNPDYEYSHPYTGGYNVGFCDTTPVPTGATGQGSYDGTTWPSLAMGDVPENMTFPDQYGEQVDLYSFCGKHIMVVISAGWCGPCRASAVALQETQDTYREDGLQIIEMITNDNIRGNPPNESFVAEWANEYGFEDIPVLAIPAPTSYTHPAFLFDKDAGIPSIYHLNEKMEVISADEMIHDPGYWL